MSLQLAKDLYDGVLDSSWLREPLPPSVHERPAGFEGEWAPVDNQFKVLVDALVADWARTRQADPASQYAAIGTATGVSELPVKDAATLAREAATEIEAAQEKGGKRLT